MNDADMSAQPFYDLQHVRSQEDGCSTPNHALQHGFQRAGGDSVYAFEWFEGVDAIAAGTLKAMLQRMIGRGATVFLTSHVLEIVERLCTHVGIIHRGRL